MPAQVHGHEVIEMMLASARPFTRESLIGAILDRFGSHTRFQTCSADGMTAAELVAFLESRGKFMTAGDGFQINPERVCRH